MSTVLQGTTYRLTFLTDRLVRLEYQPQGHFEDKPTTCARCRDFATVAIQQNRTARGLEVDTEYLHLVYHEGPFTRSGLSITVKKGMTGNQNIWRYGDPQETLGGTARTLDGADGAIPVEPGLISRMGFSVLDDSQSMVLTEDGRFFPRAYEEQDLYFFGYGWDYTACLQDFYRLAGHTPMLPRFALGNWWSRYHEYTEESYLHLMDRFQQEGIPLAVAVIDMDWHLTHVPYGSGWTGYTWNKALFPDPARFLNDLHRRGMKVTLNLHPADGVQPHEEAYASMCQAMGRDADKKQAIDFDPTDERFMQAYFTCLHHPLEAEGVDFWWIDWQQGTACAIPGLDPLWVLNARHYRDTARNGQRSLILSRYAGPGSHRYPVGFSGDTVISWASLDFQPQFTAMATNIGYPWWSHDIGGHMHGIRSDELSVRWLQLGVFSPILRLHSTKNDFTSKEPWSYGREAEEIMTDLLRLRHRFIPYLYTAAERTHRLGEALVRPMYYRYADRQEAYQVPNQYFFGTQLMVCPITTPMDRTLMLAQTTAWLPEGLWFDFATGQPYTGGRMMKLWRALEAYPVFAPAGGIVPLADDLRADVLPGHLTLRIFAGADGSYELYEDDGISLNGSSVRTAISLDWQHGTLRVHSSGDLSLLPEERTWHVECIGFAPTAVIHQGEGISTTYDASRNALCFTLQTPVAQGWEVQLEHAALAEDTWLSRIYARLSRMQSDNSEKENAWQLIKKQGRSFSCLGSLRAVCHTPGMADCLEEYLVAYDGHDAENP